MDDEAAQFRSVHPVLPVRDAAASAAFYERLGFASKLVDERYAVIWRDRVEIHLQWHDAAEFEAEVDRPMLRFYIRDIDALFEEYRDLGVFHSKTTLRDTPWGTREFAFYDPDGNGLTFYVDR